MTEAAPQTGSVQIPIYVFRPSPRVQRVFRLAGGTHELSEGITYTVTIFDNEPSDHDKMRDFFESRRKAYAWPEDEKDSKYRHFLIVFSFAASVASGVAASTIHDFIQNNRLTEDGPVSVTDTIIRRDEHGRITELVEKIYRHPPSESHDGKGQKAPSPPKKASRKRSKP